MLWSMLRMTISSSIIMDVVWVHGIVFLHFDWKILLIQKIIFLNKSTFWRIYLIFSSFWQLLNKFIQRNKHNCFNKTPWIKKDTALFYSFRFEYYSVKSVTKVYGFSWWPTTNDDYPGNFEKARRVLWHYRLLSN